MTLRGNTGVRPFDRTQSLRAAPRLTVGNLIGSNVYNILALLGVTVLAPGAGVDTTPELTRIDIPVIVAAGLVCAPVLTNIRFTRPEAALFIAAAYLGFLIGPSLKLARRPLRNCAATSPSNLRSER